MTSALAQDYAKVGIRFVGIAAGLFRTSLITWNATEAVRFCSNQV